MMQKPRQQFLKELKAYGIKMNIPNISEQTAEILQFFISMHRPKNVLEIGAANGYSTIHIASALEEIGSKMASYEISEPSYEQAKKNIEKCGLRSIVHLHFGDALRLLKGSREKFDLIFLDARKAHYHLFWELNKSVMHKGALVIVDDVIKFAEKTREFQKVIDKEKDFMKIIIPVDGDDGLMVIRRK